MFKMSTIHANTCVQTTIRHCAVAPVMMVCMVQQPSLSQQMFFHMDLRTVPQLLQYTRFKSGELGGYISRGINSWRLSLQHGDSVTCTVSDTISVTSALRHQVRDVHGV